MAGFDVFNVMPQVAENQSAQNFNDAQAKIASSSAPPTGPTGFWGRIQSIGMGAVEKVHLTNQAMGVAQIAIAAKQGVQRNIQAKGVLSGIGQSVGNVADASYLKPARTKVADLVKGIVATPQPGSDAKVKSILTNQKVAKQSMDPQVKNVLGSRPLNSPNDSVKLDKMIADKVPVSQQVDFINKSAAQANTRNKQALATGANIIALGTGGGQAKEAIAAEKGIQATTTAGKIIKTVGKVAGAAITGGAQNAAGAATDNPNISAKDAGKAFITGAKYGGALEAGGLALGKARQFVFGAKAAPVVDTATNAASTAAGSTKIKVNDLSTPTKGEVKNTLPKAAAPARPSEAGYDDTTFRLKFHDGAKDVVKSNTGTANAYLKTGSKDPLTLTVQTLADTTGGKKTGVIVDKLLPDLRTDMRTKLIKDLQETKSTSETANLLWDAAKNHEATIPKADMVGTPMDKKISFKENTANPTSSVDAKVSAGERLSGTKSESAKIESDTLNQPVSKPQTKTAPKELVNNNKGQTTGAGALKNKVSDKLKSTGKINPEQALLDKGHTEAANLVRELSGKHTAAEYLGQHAAGTFDKLASGEEKNLSSFAAAREAGTNSEAHGHFVKTLQDTGKRASDAGVIKAPRDETYVPRMAKFDDASKSGGVGGLQRSGGFSKARAQAGEFGEAGDKYKTYAEFQKAVESSGGKVTNASTSDVLGHTVTSREKAIANSEFITKAKDTAMADGRPAIATFSQDKGLPAKLSGYNTSLIPGNAIHPDLVAAIKPIVEGGGGQNLLNKLNVTAKRFVTANGIIHDFNYARSSLGEQGLMGTVRNARPIDIVAKGMADPVFHKATMDSIKDGVQYSGTGRFNLYDQTTSKLNQKIEGALGKTRESMDKIVFGIGDSLGRSTWENVKSKLIAQGIPEEEAGKVAANAANRVMFTQRLSQQSSEFKNVGRAALFAKNFLQSSLQKGSTALGIAKNTALSAPAQRAEQKQAILAISRSFAYLMAGAEAMNYASTGHSTFENKDSKLSPVFYVDKATGKEYHLTNWYGQLDTLMHVTDPKTLIGKLSPGVQQIARIVSNQDQPGYSSSGSVRDTSASGLRQWGQIIANGLEHTITPGGLDANRVTQMFGANHQPGAVSAAQMLGFGASSKDETGAQKEISKLYISTLPTGMSPSTSGAPKAPKTSQDKFDSLPSADKIKIIQKYGSDKLQKQGISTDSFAKAVVGSDAKKTITSLNNKGYSNEDIQKVLSENGYDSTQLGRIKSNAKANARANAAKSRSTPKYVNPFTR